MDFENVSPESLTSGYVYACPHGWSCSYGNTILVTCGNDLWNAPLCANGQHYLATLQVKNAYMETAVAGLYPRSLYTISFFAARRDTEDTTNLASLSVYVDGDFLYRTAEGGAHLPTKDGQAGIDQPAILQHIPEPPHARKSKRPPTRTPLHTALCPCSNIQAMRRAHLLHGAVPS